MNKDKVRLCYSKFLNKNYEEYGLVSYDKIPRIFIKNFEHMRNLAELKALSKYSLENPLTDIQYKRLMKLKNEVFK